MRFIKNALPCNETDLTVRSVRRRYALGCLAFVCLSLNGCSAQVEDASETAGSNQPPISDPVASQSTQLAASAAWSDQVAGPVRVRQTVCDWVGPSATPTALCGIGGSDWDDYALIGGGAEVENIAHTAGALLTSSWAPPGPMGPDDRRNWVASSKDHSAPYSHRLRAYTIGLKLEGISGAVLRSKVKFTDKDSTFDTSTPTSFATVPLGHILLGGGAKTLYSGAGQLLVNTYPEQSGGVWRWRVDSKDHEYANPGRIRAQVISIVENPWGTGNGLVNYFFSKNSATVTTGYTSVTPLGASPSAYDLRMLSISPGGPPGAHSETYVMVGLGARTKTTGGAAGRLLTDLFPFGWDKGAVYARTKDHVYGQSGYIEGWMVGLKRL